MAIKPKSAEQPLKGLNVVEVAEGVGGPFCGRLLAAFGANVVKVERPPHGDWTRGARPRLPDVPESEASALFLYLNMGKKSVVLDWESDEGASSLAGLLRDADILIEDWPHDFQAGPRILEEAKSYNPGLIDLSLTPFGTTGPYRSWKTTPLVSLALGGNLYLCGDEDREPLLIPGYQSEYMLGLHGYSGAMMALWERGETGFGPRIEVSEIESLAAVHQFTFVMHTYAGLVRRRHGARWENQGVYGRYPITLLPCKDGYMSYAISTDGQWEMLFPMMGRPELTEEPWYTDTQERRDRVDEIDAIMIDWMKDKTRQEVFEIAAGTWSIPASPLLDLAEALQDPQLELREFFADVSHPDAGTLTYPTAPFRMSLTQPSFDRAPRLGEHTSTVIGDTERPFDSTSLRSGQSERRSRSEPLRRREGGALSGVRVVDLTRVWAGPLATRVLGDFGAHIIKVGDPRMPYERNAGLQSKLGRNKLSVGLRLDLKEGRDAFLELVAVSDVVVENFRPRVMRNFGLTYEDLREARPDIIMCSMPGYGTEGEYAEYPAFGPSVEATTGLSSMMGYEGGPPRTSSQALPDPVAALNSVSAIMTALYHRRKTGRGQFIDMALSEGEICHIGEYIAAHSRTGEQPPRSGNSHPDHAPYGVYPAMGDDEWVAVCVTSDEQWQALCELVGSPELASDPRLAEQSARRENSSLADAVVSKLTSCRDGAAAASALQEVGIASGLVGNNWQVMADPHLNDRGFFVEIEEPDVGPKVYDGQAIRMDGIDPSKWTPSERLGEHTIQVFEELVGWNVPAIEDLEHKGILGIFRED